ncbi:MAG: DUF945 family protein [Thermodesulfobacteriota bacterium]
MKKAFVGATLVAVVLAASFYVTGRQVEKVLMETLERMAAQSPDLTVTPKGISGGIFSSRLEYNIKLNLPPDRRNPSRPNLLSIDAVYDVAHGPAPIASGGLTPCMAEITSTFTVQQDSSPDIAAFFKELPELEKSKARTRVGFDSSMSTALEIPAFTKTVTNALGVPSTFAWKGLTGSFEMPGDFSSLTGALAAPGLTIQDKDASVTLGGMKCEVNARILVRNLWSGHYSVRLDSLEVKPVNEERISIRDVAVAHSLTPRGDVMDYLIDASGQFPVENGRQLPVKMSLALKNLDIPALSDLADLMRKPPAPSISEAELRDIGNAMLPCSPRIELDAEAVEEGGKLTLHAELHAEGMKTLPMHALQALPMLRMSAGFSGREEGVASLVCALAANKQAGQSKEQCLASLTAQVGQFADRGYITREGGILAARALWDGTNFTINGKQLR